MERTGETANLGVARDGHVLFVSQVETHASIRAFFPPGTLSPMHASGIGKALLAQMPPELRAQALAKAGSERFTARTLTDPAAIEADMALTRQRGYAIDDEEKTEGMRCIAAPVMRPSWRGGGRDLRLRAVEPSERGRDRPAGQRRHGGGGVAVEGAGRGHARRLNLRRDRRRPSPPPSTHGSRCWRPVRQGGDDLPQDTAVGVDIAAAHLQEIVERPGDHVTLLDLRNLADRRVERLERIFPRVATGAPRRRSHGQGPAFPGSSTAR
jgi:hypothetical protein